MNRGLIPGLLLAAFLGAATPSPAELAITATAGAVALPGDVTGGGDIATIFRQAADYWEAIYSDPAQPWTLDLTYSWSSLGDSAVAQFVPTVIDATNNRILAGTVTFNSDGLVLWYADPHPDIILGNPAFSATPLITNHPVNLPDRSFDLNVGITFTTTPDSPAFGRTDFLTIAMHEIGHGLGLLYRPDVFPNEPPFYEAPHPLTVTPVVSPFYTGLTIDTYRSEHLFDPSLMAESASPGFRYLPSVNDILAMAVITQYQNPNLNPFNLNLPVPEPATTLLFLAGSLILIRRQRPH